MGRGAGVLCEGKCGSFYLPPMSAALWPRFGGLGEANLLREKVELAPSGVEKSIDIVCCGAGVPTCFSMPAMLTVEAASRPMLSLLLGDCAVLRKQLASVRIVPFYGGAAPTLLRELTLLSCKLKVRLASMSSLFFASSMVLGWYLREAAVGSVPDVTDGTSSLSL